MSTTEQDFTKVVRIGSHPASVYGKPVSIFCKIVYKDSKLSITGVEGPKANGDAIGSCDQIVMSLIAEEIEPAPGWTTGTIQWFLAIWDEWHLNDMNAGSPRQTAWLRAHNADYEAAKALKYIDHYTWAKQALTEAGLQPDTYYLVKNKEGKDVPYSYGSKWLGVAVPEDVLAFLKALPDTDMQPAWV